MSPEGQFGLSPDTSEARQLVEANRSLGQHGEFERQGCSGPEAATTPRGVEEWCGWFELEDRDRVRYAPVARSLGGGAAVARWAVPRPSLVSMLLVVGGAGCSTVYVQPFGECTGCGCGDAIEAETYLDLDRDDLLGALRAARREVEKGQPRVVVNEIVDHDWFTDRVLTVERGCVPILRGTGTARLEVGDLTLDATWRISASETRFPPHRPPTLALVGTAPVSSDPGVDLPEHAVGRAWRWVEADLGSDGHSGGVGLQTEDARNGRAGKDVVVATW